MSFHRASRLHLAGIATVLALLVSVPASEAQNSTASAGLTVSRHGSMQCADFAALSPGQRDSLVRRIATSVPVQSLSTSVGPNIDPQTGQETSDPNGGASVAGTPLSAGELIAACQAASPGTSLKDAFSKFNYTSHAVPL
ncbi:MAG: hypothetical protein ABI377_00405 [Devosia sp.]